MKSKLVVKISSRLAVWLVLFFTGGYRFLSFSAYFGHATTSVLNMTAGADGLKTIINTAITKPKTEKSVTVAGSSSTKTDGGGSSEKVNLTKGVSLLGKSFSSRTSSLFGGRSSGRGSSDSGKDSSASVTESASTESSASSQAPTTTTTERQKDNVYQTQRDFLEKTIGKTTEYDSDDSQKDDEATVNGDSRGDDEVTINGDDDSDGIPVDYDPNDIPPELYEYFKNNDLSCLGLTNEQGVLAETEEAEREETAEEKAAVEEALKSLREKFGKDKFPELKTIKLGDGMAEEKERETQAERSQQTLETQAERSTELDDVTVEEKTEDKTVPAPEKTEDKPEVSPEKTPEDGKTLARDEKQGRKTLGFFEVKEKPEEEKKTLEDITSLNLWSDPIKLEKKDMSEDARSYHEIMRQKELHRVDIQDAKNLALVLPKFLKNLKTIRLSLMSDEVVEKFATEILPLTKSLRYLDLSACRLGLRDIRRVVIEIPRTQIVSLFLCQNTQIGEYGFPFLFPALIDRYHEYSWSTSKICKTSFEYENQSCGRGSSTAASSESQSSSGSTSSQTPQSSGSTAASSQSGGSQSQSSQGGSQSQSSRSSVNDKTSADNNSSTAASQSSSSHSSSSQKSQDAAQRSWEDLQFTLRCSKECKNQKDENIILNKSNKTRKGTGIAAGSGLRTLDLSYNPLGTVPRNIPVLSAVIARTAITTLTLNSCLIKGGKGIAALAAVLPETRLSMLALCSNNLGPTGAKLLAEGLKNSTTMVSIDLTATNLKDKGATHLANILPTTRIKSLTLGKNSLTWRSMKAFADSLQKWAQSPSRGVVSLNLSGNSDIGLKGLKKLAPILPKTEITCLDLYGCLIGPEGAKILAEVLPQTQIMTLDLGLNILRAEGVKALGRVLAPVPKDTKSGDFLRLESQTDWRKMSIIDRLASIVDDDFYIVNDTTPDEKSTANNQGTTTNDNTTNDNTTNDANVAEIYERVTVKDAIHGDDSGTDGITEDSSNGANGAETSESTRPSESIKDADTVIKDADYFNRMRARSRASIEADDDANSDSKDTESQEQGHFLTELDLCSNGLSFNDCAMFVNDIKGNLTLRSLRFCLGFQIDGRSPSGKELYINGNFMKPEKALPNCEIKW